MKTLRGLRIRWGGGMLILALFALFCANAAVAYLSRPAWNEVHAQIHVVPLENVDDRLDINRATAQELTRLNGIGEVLARRIVDYRDEHGPFADVEELMRVDGIGEAKLAAIRTQIRVTCAF